MDLSSSGRSLSCCVLAFIVLCSCLNVNIAKQTEANNEHTGISQGKSKKTPYVDLRGHTHK